MCVNKALIFIDIRCDNISVPANGNTSCSSGREGVGYDGDTCNFTCNTGYELTGSDTRTCKSDGNWSGTDTICKRGIYNYICGYMVLLYSITICRHELCISCTVASYVAIYSKF